jgi:hypothetical protein
VSLDLPDMQDLPEGESKLLNQRIAPDAKAGGLDLPHMHAQSEDRKVLNERIALGQKDGGVEVPQVHGASDGGELPNRSSALGAKAASLDLPRLPGMSEDGAGAGFDVSPVHASGIPKARVAVWRIPVWSPKRRSPETEIDGRGGCP